MKYMLMIYSTGDRLSDMSHERRESDGEEHGAFAEYLTERDIPFSWMVLQDQSTITTILPDVDDSHLVTDGPYVTLNEYLGGYYIIETATLDEAIEAARRCPNDCRVEVRPVAFASDAVGSS